MVRRKRSYYDLPRKESGSRKAGRLYSAVDLIMSAVSALVALAVILSWCARWINPATYGFMSSMGLVMPVLFTANFMCLLYWVIRWRKGVFIPLVIFLAGICSITMFFRPQLTESYEDLSRDRSVFNVMTYNVRGMMQTVEGQRKLSSSMDDVITVIDSLDPAILCMQEFQFTPQFTKRYFEEALPLYRYKRIGFTIADSDDLGWGVAIYSKFPIANAGHVDFDSSGNSLMWADIAVNRDTVRVFNAHLQTTSISAADEGYIVNMNFVTDSTRTTHVRRMIRNLRDNNIRRAVQADTLAARIASSPYPVIVCGDFNDTPMSYTYRVVNKGLKDSFREAGRGYGYSYRGFFNLLRIDYAMHSKNMECVEYVSPSFDYSDHNPVAVKLRFKQKR